MEEKDTSIYNQILHYDKKPFCYYCLQSFTTTHILERHGNNCFKINGKQIIKIAKNVKLLNLKTIGEKKNCHS